MLGDKKNILKMKKRKLNSRNPKYTGEIVKPKVIKKIPLGNTGKAFAVFYENSHKLNTNTNG